MKKYFKLSFFLLLFALPGFAQPSKHVVLITIDGFRPDFYRQDGWNTPNLHQLMSAGSYANGVRGVFPTVTFPSHTTIITGAMPLKHGICYNTPFEPDGETGKWYWEYSAIKIPTLWTAVHNAGLKSAAVLWPVTVGAPIDYDMPENKSIINKKDLLNPVRDFTTPKGLFQEIEQNATGKLTSDGMNVDNLVFDENLARTAAYLIQTYKPALIAVHLPCVDHAEHAHGRDGQEVRTAVAGADHSVGRILEAIKMAGMSDNTTVIVTGDHGFVDIHTALSPNVWLEQNDIKTFSDSKGEWVARFHTSGASAFLILHDKNDRKTVAKVRDIIEQLPHGQRKLFRVVDRPEMDRIGAATDVQLALAPIPGIAMISNNKGEAVTSTHGGTHGYFPDFPEIQTGFIVSGAGIAKGTVIPQMGLEDIAPLIAKLLGLNYTAPDGVLFPGLLAGKQVNLQSYK